MGLVYPDLPTVGSPNSTEQPKVRQSLIDLRDTINGAIAAANLASDSVTTAKILDDAVTAAKIADNAIVQANMSDDSVGAGEIIADSVGVSELNPAYIQSYSVSVSGASGAQALTWPTEMASAFYGCVAMAVGTSTQACDVAATSVTSTTVNLVWSNGPAGSFSIHVIGLIF